MTSEYKKREFYSLGNWSIGDHTLKAYGISARKDGKLEQPLIDAGREYAEGLLLAAAEAEGESERLGYSMIHRGTLGAWLLIHWWAHEDICCGRLALAATGTTHFESMDDRPLLACVWEQVVMQHERDAWVRHMLSATPDAPGYLKDTLPHGLY